MGHAVTMNTLFFPFKAILRAESRKIHRDGQIIIVGMNTLEQTEALKTNAVNRKLENHNHPSEKYCTFDIFMTVD